MKWLASLQEIEVQERLLSVYVIEGHVIAKAVTDKLIAWRLRGPFFKSKFAKDDANIIPKELTIMQRQWTIEVRADCSPEEKEAINTAIRRSARHLLTQVGLVPTKVAVEVVAYSEDFFDGHEDIQLWDDFQGKAFEAHDAQEDQPSSELLEAARDMRHAAK